MDSNKKLFVVILNYNSAEDSMECISSLYSVKKLKIHIVLVDNGSSKECIQQLDSFINGDIVFIKNPQNMGYAAGNNVGIQYAVDHGADYISVVNNDVIVNEDSFTQSVKALDSDENVGIVGPVIIDASSKRIQSAGAAINYYKAGVDLIRRDEKFYPIDDLTECDYVGGACMTFTPKVIKTVGYIPENYFLFWEEAEWCLHAKKAGFKVCCAAGSSVEHKGSATVNKMHGFSTYYMERNKIIFLRRNYPNKLKMTAAVIYLFLRCLVKAVIDDPHYIRMLLYYRDGFLDYDRMLDSH